jgi:hypothetical protein
VTLKLYGATSDWLPVRESDPLPQMCSRPAQAVAKLTEVGKPDAPNTGVD